MVLIYAVAIVCVIGLAIGQILFKLSATAFAQAHSVYSLKALISLAVAMTLYAATSVAWVWVLRKIELGKVYPLMALGFVLVPLGSHFVFGEKFSHGYYIGVLLIVVGILVVVKS